MSRQRIAAVLAITSLGLIGAVIAIAGTAPRGPSADVPPFAQDDGDYLRLRSEYVARLRGLEPGQFFSPRWRATAVQALERQQRQLRTRAGPTVATPVWSEIGPSSVANGQALDGSDTQVSGRVTAIAVDPTDSDTVYVGTAQGGVWRSLDGGSSWAPLFDSAQSLAVGALAIAPSSPSTLYVGTGEGNFSCDSFFGVGLYRIDDADTTATLVGPLNKDAGANDVFSGRAISSILVDPTDAATVFVSTLFGSGGLGCNDGASLPTQGIYRSTNATSVAASVTFARLAVQPTADLAVTGMTFVNGDPNTLLAAVFAAPVGSNGGIWRTTDALAATPSFTRTLSVSSSHTAFAVSGNTVLSAASEFGTGRVRESTDGGATWTAPLPAADGFCNGQCIYDIAVAIDPRTSGSNLRIYLGGALGDFNPGPSGMKVSNDNGASFSTDQQGLHADAHALVIDASTDPSTVWAGNDGGIWKRAADAPVGTAWTNLNDGLGTLQFQSVAVGRSDPAFAIGGTQDNGTELQQTSLGNWSQADYGDGGHTLIDQSTASTSNVTMYHTYFNISGSLVGFARADTTSCATKGNWAFRGIGFLDSTVVCGSALGAQNGIGVSDRVQFYAPMALGPGTPNTVYFGTDRLYRSTDRGDTMFWASQGPILSGFPITAIGISPTNDKIRLVGLQNGLVWGTRTGATTLTQMSGLVPPDNATGNVLNRWVGRVAIDPNDEDTAYVTYSYYTASGAGLNVWKTTNLLAASPTWTAAANGIPNIPVNAFAVDPNSSRLYAGTDIGVYTSSDGGATWTVLGTGLPAVAVFDLAVVAPGSTNEALRIATHGRGMWQPSKTGQTISFGGLAGKTFGDADFAVSATASADLPVFFAAAGACTVAGATVHLTGAGSCTVTARQPGDALIDAAADVPQTFSIAKASQAITFAALAARTFGDPDFAVAATSSSGLPVSLSTTGNCSLSGATVHITGAGSCTVTAAQAGNANLDAAPDVPRTFAIAKASQTIAFGALGAKRLGDVDFAVSATASSGLPVSFAASGGCTVSGATVHLIAAGVCTVTASQAGDVNYNAATGVAQSFTVTKPVSPAKCRVPRVVGKTLAAAKLALKRAHCATGKVVRAYSKKTKTGRVSAQSRRAGRVLAANTKVNLVVSRGPKR